MSSLGEAGDGEGLASGGVDTASGVVVGVVGCASSSGVVVGCVAVVVGVEGTANAVSDSAITGTGALMIGAVDAESAGVVLATTSSSPAASTPELAATEAAATSDAAVTETAKALPSSANAADALCASTLP